MLAKLVASLLIVVALSGCSTLGWSYRGSECVVSMQDGCAPASDVVQCSQWETECPLGPTSLAY